MDLANNTIVTGEKLAYYDRELKRYSATNFTTKADHQATQDKLDALQFTVNGLGEPYRLKDFQQVFGTPITIPSVTKDISNTSIPNVDIAITGTEAEEFAIAGLLKYEVKDASNNRLNAFPICTFSMDGQKVLRVRMMVGGPDDKAAKSINGAILLKHR